jgi:lysozyme
MDILKLTTELKRDEGVRDKPYLDTEGHLTIGVGHNLDAEGLCDAAITAQLKYDIDTKAIVPLDIHLPWWRLHPEPVQRALANLCFNLGIQSLLKFTTTLNLIQSRKYEQAARNLLKTLYAKQVGQRAQRVAQLLRDGIEVVS